MATFFSLDRERKRLEQDLQTDEYETLLRWLQGDEPFLRQFTTWADVLTFMRRGTSADPRKDEILHPILAAHCMDRDHRWRTILLVVFWPGLMSIHGKKRLWDRDDPNELWQRIYWAFHESMCRIDLKLRRDHLVQRLYNATIHRLYKQYRHDWDRHDRELTVDSGEDEELFGTTEGIDLIAIDLRRAQEREIRNLQGHLEAGRISEADFLLLVGTRVYGQSVADYARGVGLDYQVAKKRRQRAEAAIRRFDGEPR